MSGVQKRHLDLRRRANRLDRAISYHSCEAEDDLRT